MSAAGEKKLVFRLAEIGFALPIAQLVEIVEGEPERSPVDSSGAAESMPGFCHRGEVVRVRDLRRRLALPPAVAGPALVLVLVGADGPWGVRVDAVVGIHPGTEFAVRAAPGWLFQTERWPFRALLVWHGEPLVQVDAFELEARWGTGA